MLAGLVAAAFGVAAATPVLAQTPEEIIEKHLAAAGGRAALGAITSRVAIGTITLSTPVGELAGTIEVYNKAPNKSRTLINLDLSAVGGGKVVSDQRFDGTTGYVIDTFNGDRQITGTQLDAMRNGLFPTPLLTYKENGWQVALAGKEVIGGVEAHVLQMTPKSGPTIKASIRSDTFMLVKTVMTVNVPQLGQDIEQTVEFSDFRDVGGIALPHVTRSANQFQTIVATVKEFRQNEPIDDSSFVRPAQ
jgi:hypothetical protein